MLHFCIHENKMFREGRLMSLLLNATSWKNPRSGSSTIDDFDEYINSVFPLIPTLFSHKDTLFYSYIFMDKCVFQKEVFCINCPLFQCFKARMSKVMGISSVLRNTTFMWKPDFFQEYEKKKLLCGNSKQYLFMTSQPCKRVFLNSIVYN